MRRRAASALAAASAALAAAGGAWGHGGTAQLGYVSTVSHVKPLLLGLDARVLAGDDQLRVANLSGKTVVILGYDGEPYLRFTRGGVFQNLRSPAVYRNRDRWGVVNVPASADPEAAPRWRRVSVAPSYAWHDHRIQWMRRGVLPAVVRAEPRRSHKVFDWSVPGRADGKRFAIKGFLGYAPPPKPAANDDSRTALWVGAGAAVLLVLAAVTLLPRLRRR